MDLSIRQEIRDVMGDALALLEQAAQNPNAPALWRLRADATTTRIRALHATVQQNLAAGDAFYFGSVGGSEHRLFNADLSPVPGFPRINITEIPEVIAAGIDGGFLPDTQEEGSARVQVLEGWTVIALPDRSADRRAGSHSTFVMRGEFGGLLAVTQARLLFPAIFARYPFPVEVTT